MTAGRVARMRHAFAVLLLVGLLGIVEARAQEVAPPPDQESHRVELHCDYLYWYLRRLPVPPVLAKAPAGASGRIGDPGTEVLRGGRLTSRHDRYIGVRPEIDWWLDDEHTVGVQVNAFFLERDSTHFTVRQNTVPTLAVPYIDARDGSQQARIIAGHSPSEGDLSGGTRIYSRMELFGQEGNALFDLARGDGYRVHWLVGGRFLQFRERLDLTSSSTVLPEQSTLLGLEDHFSTFNKFYGIQTGVAGEYRWGRWFIDGKASLALGVDEQRIRLKGESIRHVPGNRQSQPYGLFILPSNRGTQRRAEFDLVSEWRVNAGYELTCWLRVHAGYSLLTWNNPIRPGDLVEPINLTQVQPGGLVGPLRPEVPDKSDFFWAHGANVGLEIRW